MTGRITVRRALAQSGLVPVDAQVLLGHVLGKGRAWLAAHGDDCSDARTRMRFSRWPGAGARVNRSAT